MTQTRQIKTAPLSEPRPHCFIAVLIYIIPFTEKKNSALQKLLGMMRREVCDFVDSIWHATCFQMIWFIYEIYGLNQPLTMIASANYVFPYIAQFWGFDVHIHILVVSLKSMLPFRHYMLGKLIARATCVIHAYLLYMNCFVYMVWDSKQFFYL